MLLREIKNIYHKELDQNYPKEEIDSFFYMLVEHHLGLARFVLTLDPNLVISKEQEQPLFEALSALKLHQPIQHIIGKSYFMEMDFMVNGHVLIPRPETEDLVRWIIEDVDGRLPIMRILDIGTGTGCIAISLAKHMPAAKVTAIDISEKALEMARKNADLNAVEINCVQADILQEGAIDEVFDVIVSNPPYVRQMEKKDMHKNVTEFEPDLALFVPDENPLVFYEHIARFAVKRLKKGGSLFLEINQFLGKEIQQLLEEKNFKDIELRKDIFGNDRLIRAVWPE